LLKLEGPLACDGIISLGDCKKGVNHGEGEI
jgi:hypothetical protein